MEILFAAAMSFVLKDTIISPPKYNLVKQIYCRKYAIHILEAFLLALFKRICQKYSKKDGESQLYRDTVDEIEKKKKAHRDW